MCVCVCVGWYVRATVNGSLQCWVLCTHHRCCRMFCDQLDLRFVLHYLKKHCPADNYVFIESCIVLSVYSHTIVKHFLSFFRFLFTDNLDSVQLSM